MNLQALKLIFFLPNRSFQKQDLNELDVLLFHYKNFEKKVIGFSIEKH